MLRQGFSITEPDKNGRRVWGLESQFTATELTIAIGSLTAKELPREYGNNFLIKHIESCVEGTTAALGTGVRVTPWLCYSNAPSLAATTLPSQTSFARYISAKYYDFFSWDCHFAMNVSRLGQDAQVVYVTTDGIDASYNNVWVHVHGEVW